jgi:O-antigen ligase
MSSTVPTSATQPIHAPISVSEAVAGWVAVAILLVVFVTLYPFADLGDPRLLESSSGNDTVNYVTLFVLVGISALLLYGLDRLPIWSLITKENLLLLAWLFVSIVLSTDFSTSARRFSLTGATFLLAAMLPWLTNGLRHFANLLLAVAVLVLVLSYLGVLLFPVLSIHQATDLIEVDLAGDWRGIYGHKNMAASVMAVLVFAGWFIARKGRPMTGALIAAVAFAFLLGSGGKSALGMMVLVAILAVGVAGVRSIWAKALVAFGPLVVVNILTVGSVTSETVRSLVTLLPIDVTYSGRTEIWDFALDAIRAHPWKGHGFEAFWYSDAVRFGAEDSTRWMVEVASSHNSYVDLVLTIGLPGLVLAVLAFLVVPLRDFQHALDAPANQDLARLSLVLWLFAVYYGTFEAFFLSRSNFMWFILALAVCGLHYSARFVVKD